jgi:DNA-binding IscR family transcriptional regulator
VSPSYLLKALELARRPGGVQAKELAGVLGITPRHGRRVLGALVRAGALAREPGPVPRKRSPGKAPLVYQEVGGAA